MIINALLDQKLIQHHQAKEKRSYLGASILGDECLRKIQLQYEGKEAELSAATLRTFDIGSQLESLCAEWLRIAGFYLITQNANGEQFGFSIANGKIAGHVDGLIQGLSDDLKAIGLKLPALWENKTLNNRSWKETERKGLMLSKPLYYAQVQVYMAYMNLENCLFTALNKDTSELFFELIPFDSEAAQRYSDRAVQVVQASENNEQLPCVSADPSFFKCKMCGFRKLCWNKP